jgi:TPP-dependent pyruvate/acetoin dehydrogenase alpha subunit
LLKTQSIHEARIIIHREMHRLIHTSVKNSRRPSTSHSPQEQTLAGSSTGGSLISDTKLKQLYATMLHCRLLTEHARRLGGRRRDHYSASLGQEAIATGCTIDLRSHDTIILAAHDSIAALVKGVSLTDLVARLYAGGSEADPWKSHIIHPASGHPASNGAEQLQMANDIALANKQRQKDNVVVAFTGMPAMTLGGWQPALKSAARRSLSIIFVVQNNPWVQTHANNGRLRAPLKAPIDGLTSITVDGNDVVAVYRVAYESLDRARQGGGPVLIEARPYRQDGRTLLRAERDPLLHMERYLSAKKLFTARWKNQLIQRFSRDLDDAIQSLDLETTRYLRASHAVPND